MYALHMLRWQKMNILIATSNRPHGLNIFREWTNSHSVICLTWSSPEKSIVRTDPGVEWNTAASLVDLPLHWPLTATTNIFWVCMKYGVIWSSSPLLEKSHDLADGLIYKDWQSVHTSSSEPTWGTWILLYLPKKVKLESEA